MKIRKIPCLVLIMILMLSAQSAWAGTINVGFLPTVGISVGEVDSYISRYDWKWRDKLYTNTYVTLIDSGIDMSSKTPRTISVSGTDGGMLKEKNPTGTAPAQTIPYQLVIITYYHYSEKDMWGDDYEGYVNRAYPAGTVVLDDKVTNFAVIMIFDESTAGSLSDLNSGFYSGTMNVSTSWGGGGTFEFAGENSKGKDVDIERGIGSPLITVDGDGFDLKTFSDENVGRIQLKTSYLKSSGMQPVISVYPVKKGSNTPLSYTVFTHESMPEEEYRYELVLVPVIQPESGGEVVVGSGLYGFRSNQYETVYNSYAAPDERYEVRPTVDYEIHCRPADDYSNAKGGTYESYIMVQIEADPSDV